MFKPEILAPAGSPDSVKAAVRCGADAVYLGLKNMSARRSAENFTPDELKQAVEYCHKHSVKVHLALNTLIADNELYEALESVKTACEYGVDAIIVQDIGLARLIKQCAPDMPLHASTQASVQTPSGVKRLAKLGFSRAVLPRELSRDEIARVCDSSHIEIECFVHGALCMCVSGQCYLSAMLGSRSGNRGACAQPCRLPFGAEYGTGHDLSLKDLSLMQHIKEMSALGVSSFKIEGRMKRPEYVAAAVTACRGAVDGKESEEIREDLKSVFSRTGFTDGYYTGKLGVSMFGTRRKEDVTAAAPVLKKLEKLYEKEVADSKIDFAFTAVRGENISLSARSNGINVFAESEQQPQEALNKATDAQSVETQLKKCGGTQYFPGETDIELDDNIFVPVSEINRLRREVMAQLDEKNTAKPKSFKLQEIKITPHRSGKRELICRFSNIENIPENWDGIGQIIVPLGEERKVKRSSRVSVEVPRGIFSNDERILKKLIDAKEYGITQAWAGTLDGIALIQKAGLIANASFGSNVFNSLTVNQFEEMGIHKILLSAELTLSQIQEIGGKAPRGVFAYGRLPLMLTRNCPQRNGKSCAECKRTGQLTDRRGTKFPIDCSSGASEILNSVPIYMADRLSEFRGVDFLYLSFTDESKDTASEIIKAYLDSGKPKGEFTRGLFYRGVE